MAATAPSLPSLSSLVYRKERVYYWLMLFISVPVYAAVGYFAYQRLEVLASIIAYVIIGALVFMFAQGMFLGRVRGNAIRVSAKQLPLVYRQVQEHSNALQMKKAPDVYVVEAGGVMNAFATR